MIVKIYAVVDRVSGVYDGPHKAVNEGQFLRSFADQCANPPLSNHPEDFYVVELGTFNDSNGVVIGNEEGPRRIADATDFVMTDKEVE